MFDSFVVQQKGNFSKFYLNDGKIREKNILNISLTKKKSYKIHFPFDYLSKFAENLTEC